MDILQVKINYVWKCTVITTKLSKMRLRKRKCKNDGNISVTNINPIKKFRIIVIRNSFIIGKVSAPENAEWKLK
jgi:hypothetical protein